MRAVPSRATRVLVATAAALLLALCLRAAAPLDGDERAPSVDPGQVPAVGPHIELLDHGGTCDGHTDDRQAFVDALDHLATSGGGTLELPPRDCLVRQTVGTVFLRVPSNVTIQGQGEASRVELSCDDPESYVELFRLEGESIALRDLSLERASECYGVMVSLRITKGLTLDHVVIDGHTDQFPQTMHGIILGHVEGMSQAFLLDSVVLRRLDYGLFQANDVTSAIVGVTVRDSLFEQNRQDDLEFNAPSGSMQQVVVQDNTFRDNRATEGGAGIGVGLANVQNARIVGNTFDSYGFEPIHIEDRSAHVEIQSNRFTAAFTADLPWASHVFIVNGSSDVHISQNVFDASLNTNAFHAVFVNAGGAGFPAPQDVVVEDNQLIARSDAELVYSEGIDGVVVQDNEVTTLD